MTQSFSHKENVIIDVNSNFHHIAGENILSPQSSVLFKEYRKKWREWPETFYVGEFPLFIDMEVTNNCIYKCTFCATSYFGQEIKRGFVEEAIVKRVIDEGAEKGLYGIKFNDRGEPLMHKQLFEFVSYAKKKGLIDVYFNTNGYLMNEEICRKIIDTGLDRISISVEGMNSEQYEKYRIGGDFGTVLNNIHILLNLRNKLNSPSPRIRIQIVLLDEIKTQIEEYRQFWSGFADEVCFLDYKEEARNELRYIHDDIKWACHQLWQRMVIWWDGTILPCNEDDRGVLSLGNIRDRSIEDVWNGSYLKLLREKHQLGLSCSVSPCNKCYLRDSEIKKIKNLDCNDKKMER